MAHKYWRTETKTIEININVLWPRSRTRDYLEQIQLAVWAGGGGRGVRWVGGFWGNWIQALRIASPAVHTLFSHKNVVMLFFRLRLKILILEFLFLFLFLIIISSSLHFRFRLYWGFNYQWSRWKKKFLFYIYRTHSLRFILKIFLKFRKFQPRYSYKIYCYRKDCNRSILILYVVEVSSLR